MELTDDEIDVLSGMMIIFMHAAERCVQVIENHYCTQYKAGSDYKRLAKIYGKAKADEILSHQVTRIVRGSERNNIGKILNTAETLHKQMEALTDSAIVAHGDNATDMQSFDAIMHDSNNLCRLYAMMCNCMGKDDDIKIESTLRAMAKGNRCSERIIQQFDVK